MCWSLYLAATAALPNVAWIEDEPGFYASELDDIDRVRMLGLSLPYRKFLGAQTGCGCGFADDDDVDRQTILAALCEYLAHAAAFGEVELAMLWEGQEIDENAQPLSLKLSDFTRNTFPLADGFTLGPVSAIVQS